MSGATENGDREELRRPPDLPEDRERGGSPDDVEKQDEWTDAGTEDPAFFIKPSDGE